MCNVAMWLFALVPFPMLKKRSTVHRACQTTLLPDLPLPYLPTMSATYPGPHCPTRSPTSSRTAGHPRHLYRVRSTAPRSAAAGPQGRWGSVRAPGTSSQGRWFVVAQMLSTQSCTADSIMSDGGTRWDGCGGGSSGDEVKLGALG